MSASDHLNPHQFAVEHQGSHPFGGEWATAHRVDDPLKNVVGHMRFTPHPEGPNAYPIPHTDVNYISVDESHQGQGISKLLYSTVAEKTGIPFLHSKENMSKAGFGAARSAAQDNPEQHKIIGWAKTGGQVAKPFPRKRAR